MSIKSILEPESQVPIYDECDVLVVGGGSAGHSAAIAAARPAGPPPTMTKSYCFIAHSSYNSLFKPTTRLLPTPFFVISNMLIPSSRSKISIVRGAQKPA